MALTPQELKEALVGPSVTLVTPFKAGSLELDEKGLAENTRWLIDRGLTTGNGTLIAGGSNGECYTLTDGERKRVAEIVVAEAAGRVPVLVGTNHTATNLALDLARHADQIGADGIMSTPPYYLEPTQGDMLRFYRALAKAVDIGIMIYDIAEVAKAGVADETLEALCELDNVVSLKAGQPSFEDYARKTLKFRHRLACISNTGLLVGAGYLFGTSGFISGIGNAYPELEMDLHKAGVKGDWEKVAEIEEKRKLFYLCMGKMQGDYGKYGGITLLQTATALAGCAGGIPRPPAYPLSAADSEIVRQTLVEMGAI